MTKEQILFILVLLVLGGMTYLHGSDRPKSRKTPPSRRMEVETLPAHSEVQFPDEVGRSDGSRVFDLKGRNIFAPPRDWLPLEPLVLDPPPLARLDPIGPFTEPALAPSFYSSYVCSPVSPVEPEADQALTADERAEEEVESVAGESERGTGLVITLDSLEQEDDPEAALLAQYDWIRLDGQTSRIFGHVLNQDPYGLTRTKEPIRFEMVAKGSGKTLGVHDYPRDRVQDFGLADTTVNRIEMAIRGLSLHAGNLNKIHETARWCLSFKEEDVRAVDYAVSLARQAIDLDPLSRESYCLLADIHERAFDLESALKVLRSAVDRKLNAPGVYLRFGRILRRYDLDKTALEAYLRAEAIEPRYAGALAARADLAYDQGLFQQSLDLFEEAWRSPSWKPEMKLEVLKGEARSFLALNRLQEASAKAQRALGLDAEDGDAWNLKGAIALAGGDPVAAEEAFRQAVTFAPQRSAFVTNLGTTLFRLADYEGAVRKLEEAIGLDPFHSGRALAALGYVQESLGEDEPASSTYDQATQVDPNNAYALYLLGRNLWKRGDVDSSIQVFQRALQRNDSMIELLGELGFACLLGGYSDKAAVYLDEALKRGKTTPTVQYLSGLAYLRLNRLVEAMSQFDQAIALSENNPDPFNGLGYARYLRGEVAESLDAFGQVIRFFEDGVEDPRLEYARRWMGRIEEHSRKSQWIDHFQRNEIKNNWNLLQRSGPTIKLINNEVVIQGLQRQEQPDERTALRRVDVPGRSFRRFEVDLTALDGNQGEMGVYMGLYISRAAQGTLTKAEVALGLEANGALRYRVIDRSQILVDWQRIGSGRLTPGETVRLGFEVVDYDQGQIRLFVDGEPVLAEDLIVKSLKKVTRGLVLGVYGAAPGSRKVHCKIDHARIVVRN